MRERFSTRAEIRLIERAIREGWPTPPDQRRREMERLAALAADPATPARLALAAARVVLLADGGYGPPRREPRRQPGGPAGGGRNRHSRAPHTPPRVGRQTRPASRSQRQTSDSDP